jgi:hypothetical protein
MFMAKRKASRAAPKKKAAPKSGAKSKSAVTVRMYCQGLGDCFLISFQRKSGKPCRVLIDCGVFQNTPDDKEKLNAVAQSLLDETGGVIDVLIISHEHWDHISGFSFANAIFQKFDFKQVWLSWAENPKDPDAKKVKGELGKKKAKIAAAMQAVQTAGGLGAVTSLGLRRNLEETSQLMGFFGPAIRETGAPRMKLGDTMDWLRSKVSENAFREPGECLTLPGVDGVKAYILGPPKNVASIRKMDPSGDQGYRNLAATASLMGAIEWLTDPNSKTDLPPGPFDDCYSLSVGEAQSDPFFRDHYGFAEDPLGQGSTAWRRIDDDWLGAVGRFALQLDVGINNTSLALAFELPDSRTLIFPGDAQIGNWLSWDAVKFKDEDGKALSTTSKDLLNRAVFYKVGHPGSHNATRKAGGLEEMTSGDLVAMIPTDEDFAKTKHPPKDGWKMPFSILYEALKQQTDTRIARADFNQKETTNLAAASGSESSFLKRLKFSSQPLLPSLKDRPLYVEYTL